VGAVERRGAVAAAQAALDGALDVVGGDVIALGGRQGVLERQVGGRIGARALADGRLDRPDVLADDLAALVVVRGLLALDLRPLVMTCHPRLPFDPGRRVAATQVSDQNTPFASSFYRTLARPPSTSTSQAGVP